MAHFTAALWKAIAILTPSVVSKEKATKYLPEQPLAFVIQHGSYEALVECYQKHVSPSTCRHLMGLCTRCQNSNDHSCNQHDKLSSSLGYTSDLHDAIYIDNRAHVHLLRACCSPQIWAAAEDTTCLLTSIPHTVYGRCGFSIRLGKQLQSDSPSLHCQAIEQ